MNQEQQNEPIGRATYSPEDNKLRLYADARLSPEVYARIKAAGFGWAPKQELFVAPMWTPQRYDLLVELCGEVGDEEGTLQERAEQRAERFTRYKANRHRDAHSAADRVAQLTEHIPMGQPILVGHHSQDKAERQAKKITRAMETAVDQWSRHEYWKQRIPAVMDHAEWKGDARLRHRRIKGLEADQRKFQVQVDNRAQFAQAWSAEGITSRRAWQLAGQDRSGAYDILRNKTEAGENEWLCELPAELIEQARQHAIEVHTNGSGVRHNHRWLEHTTLRLSFERDMMERQGGDMRERFEFAVGGRVQGGRWSRGAWQTILRVNKSAGKINSLTCQAPAGEQWGARVRVEDVTAYEPPADGAAEEVKKAIKPAPLCNYPGEGFEHITEAEYKARGAWAKDTKTLKSETVGRHRVRSWISKVGGEGYSRLCPVYLTDKKTTLPPAITPPPTDPEPLPDNLRFELTEADVAETPAPRAPRQEAAAPTLFDQMKDSLKAGVQTVVAHQLYPTPPDIARRMCELAGSAIYGASILEPSAGTGELIKAAQNYATGADNVRITAVEINHGLVQQLEQRRSLTVGATPETCRIVHADFLTTNPDELGQFGVVLMNPPFENASDIKHIQHALKFLKPGGVLVGICADGPRQNAWLEEHATSIEKLPAGTFAGTQVRTAMFTIDA